MLLDRKERKLLKTIYKLKTTDIERHELINFHDCEIVNILWCNNNVAYIQRLTDTGILFSIAKVNHKTATELYNELTKEN